jgi:hypothetical protein
MDGSDVHLSDRICDGFDRLLGYLRLAAMNEARTRMSFFS